MFIVTKSEKPWVLIWFCV